MKMLKKPDKIPKTPGIYFFKDTLGKTIYIGKAANLKGRLFSYFDKQEKPLKVQQMLDRATSTDWQETDSEIEALILESRLIKKTRPEFNILMRDDKQYFYVVIADEQFPKIKITHRPPSDGQAIGPFTEGMALKSALKILRRIFPYCSCKQKHNNYCLNYHIGNCFGYCCLKKESNKQQQKNYKKNTRAIIEILEGKKLSLIKKLTKKMKIVAKAGKLEEAIEIRGQINKLEKVFENARVISQISKRAQGLVELKNLLELDNALARIEAYDISNIQGEFAVGSMVVFENGQSDKNEYKKFKIIVDGRADDTSMIKEVLKRRFRHTEWQLPDLILIDGGRGQINATLSVLEKFNLKIPVISLTKDIHHKGHHIFSSHIKKLIQLSEISEPAKNFIIQIDSEAHRFAISYYRKLHAKKILN